MLSVRRLIYKELEQAQKNDSGAMSLLGAISDQPQDHENDIVKYLETAPNYSAMGKLVGDIINPLESVVLFKGKNTDGLFLWPTELGYYVRKYHVRLPTDFIERMAALNWTPPPKSSINWDELYIALSAI